MATSKEKKGNGNALIVADQYSVTRTDNVLEALKENLGDDTLSVSDLDRVRIPSAGNLMWTVPDFQEANGEKNVKEIIGLPVWFKDERVYYEKSFEETGGGERPDCSSTDCKTGRGIPGGTCKTCAMNIFGSAKGGNGKGKACREIRLFYVAIKNEKLPMVIVLSPMSKAAMKNYLQRLGSKDIKYWKTETSFTLEKAKSSAGIIYSRIVPRPTKQLDDDAAARFLAYREGLIPYLSADASRIVEEEGIRKDVE